MTADIVEWLREARHNDHDRGCEGRMYTCTCGYDNRIFAAAEEAADDIEKLRRERDEALEGPWAKWADEIRKILMGYGVDPGDEWDLPEQFELWIAGVVENETGRATFAEAELTRLRAELERIAYQCTSDEIPQEAIDSMEQSADWHAGYDAAIHAARTALQPGDASQSGGGDA